MKMGKKLAITVNLTKVETGNIIGTSDITIDNMDSVYDSLTILTTKLIKSSLGLNNFTFSTETEGYSLEFAANYLTDFKDNGGGFTLGFTIGRGNFWTGYSTTWNFTTVNKTGNIPFGSQKKIVDCLGAMNFIFGNKVQGLALLLGIGCGYDFQGGIPITPFIGTYYKNFYVKYTPAFVINFEGPIQNYHLIEVGYSLFLGNEGKEVVNFK